MSDLNALNSGSNDAQIEQAKRAQEQKQAQNKEPATADSNDKDVKKDSPVQRKMSAGEESFKMPSLGSLAQDAGMNKLLDYKNQAPKLNDFASDAKEIVGKLTPGDYKDGLEADLKVPGEHVEFKKGEAGKEDKVKHCGENGCFANNDWSEAPESHKNALQLAHDKGSNTSSDVADAPQAQESIQEFRENNFGKNYDSNPAYAQAKKDMLSLNGADENTKASLREIMSTGSLSKSSKDELISSYQKANSGISELKNSIKDAPEAQKAKLQSQLTDLEQAQTARKKVGALTKKYAKAPDGSVVRDQGDKKVLKLSTGETGKYLAGKFEAEKKAELETKPEPEVKAVEKQKAEAVKEVEAQETLIVENALEKALTDFDVPESQKESFRKEGGVFVFSTDDCKYCDEQHKQVFGSKNDPRNTTFIDGKTPYIEKKFNGDRGKILQKLFGNKGKGIFPFSVRIGPQGRIRGNAPGYSDMPIIRRLSRQ